MDDLIHRTSHTLQLLIEYDPVRQRLDRLRLGSPRSQLEVPATSRMRLSSPSDTVVERTDKVEDSTLKRRSLRCVGWLLCCGSVADERRAYIFLKRLFIHLRRSNSICKSPGPNSPKESPLITRDIGRSESLRSSSSCSHRIFRPCDLIHGEVLGKGFFGQAIKVGHQLFTGRCIHLSAVCELQMTFVFITGDSQSYRRGDGDEGADPLR